MVKLPLRGAVHPIAALLNRPGVQFRLPKFADLKGAYTDKTLKIPEDVFKQRVTQLLQRMRKEKRLKSKAPIRRIVKRIFPSPGVIDEAEFNKAIDVNDRSRIYESVAEADTKVRAADQPNLKTAMKDSVTLIKKVEGDTVGLKQVFGAQDTVAKTNYAGARKALDDCVKDMDAHVTTDYNLDDPEVGLGGFASHADQKMHLLLDVVKVTDVKETKITVIHEAAHFANASVQDKVYYANDGFFELDEARKVANAAHYEELPRRELKTSQFDGIPFTPGVKPGGGKVNRKDRVRAEVDLYVRTAWDASVDAHMFIRDVRVKLEAGDDKPFKKHKALILEISRLMDLTIHAQAAGKETITPLDVTLSESISRGVSIVKDSAASTAFPIVVAKLTDVQLRDKIVARTVKKYGNLLRDPVRDKALLDWCVSKFQKLPSI